jgi:hypothetical protein
MYRIIVNRGFDNKIMSEVFNELYNYKSLLHRIKWDNDEWLPSLKEQPRFSFEIKVTKDNILFYFFSNNSQDINIITKNFNKCTIKEDENNIPTENISVAEMELYYHYTLSLSTDKRELEPIASIMESQKLLKDNECAIVQYILEPESVDWYLPCNEILKNKKIPTQFRLDSATIGRYAGNTLANLAVGTLNFIQELFVKDVEKIELEDLHSRDITISGATKLKTKYNAYNVGIRLIAHSKNPEKREQILRHLIASYNTVKLDNYLVPRYCRVSKELINDIKLRKRSFSFVNNILSTEEVAKLIMFPQATLQSEYKLDSIDTREIEFPSCLLSGSILIGTSTFKGKCFNVYWNDSYNVLTLPKVIVGAMGAGKTEYAVRYAVEAGNKGDAVVVFDYIKNCELSDKIKKHTKAKVYEIDLSKDVFSLAFNEVEITKDNALEKANQISEQVSYLIDTLSNDKMQPLTPRMDRYLSAASKVVFINPNEKLKSVIDVLQYHEIRHKYIDKALQSGIFTEIDYEIKDLLSLDVRDKEGNIIDTKDSTIDGILDRFNLLIKNIYLRRMCEVDPKVNPDFKKLFDEGYTILIKMPADKFSGRQVKDSLVTFFMSKIWLTELIRGGMYSKPKIVHVITDEIHQIPVASKLISETIDEARKYGCAYFFTVHYLKQFRWLLDSVKSSGVSYMLLGGTEKENYISLKEELSDFSIEEAMATKPFHSLNIVNYGNAKVVFSSELPKLLE